jgi:hypothetical protein
MDRTITAICEDKGGLKMRKGKMTKKEMNMAMLAEVLRSLNEIVMDEEPEDWDEESKDEKLSDGE